MDSTFTNLFVGRGILITNMMLYYSSSRKRINSTTQWSNPLKIGYVLKTVSVVVNSTRRFTKDSLKQWVFSTKNQCIARERASTHQVTETTIVLSLKGDTVGEGLRRSTEGCWSAARHSTWYLQRQNDVITRRHTASGCTTGCQEASSRQRSFCGESLRCIRRKWPVITRIESRLDS